MNCFRAWEETALYSSDLLIKLQNIFLGLIPSKSLKSSDSTKEFDIDGVPIDPDLDGQELDDDGLNIKKRKDTLFTQSFRPSKWEKEEVSLKPKSKWETSDKTTGIFDEGEDEDIDGEPLDDNDYFETLIQQKKTPKPNSSQPYNNNDNQNSLTREVLRDIELKVIKYQDNLDNDIRKGRFALQSGETVDTLVEKYRNELKRKALSGNVDYTNKISGSQSSRRDRSPSSPRSRYHSSSSSTRKHSHSPRRSRSRSPTRRK